MLLKYKRCRIFFAGVLFCILPSSFAKEPPNFSNQLAEVIQEIRVKGCKGTQGISRLNKVQELDLAAQRFTPSSNLTSLMSEAGYRSVKSKMIGLGGQKSFVSLRSTLIGSYCDAILDPSFTDLGIGGSMSSAVILLSTPFVREIPNRTETIHEVVALVNAARQTGASCGSMHMPPVKPVQLHAKLTASSQFHAEDMARKDYYAHASQDGRTPTARMKEAGYVARTTGENIAAGQQTAREVVASWLLSPGHCKNMLNDQFTDIGLGVAININSQKGIYWVQNFGSGEK